MTETYEMHGSVITIKPMGRGTWGWETFHRELCLTTRGGAHSKVKAKEDAEATSAAIESGKDSIRRRIEESHRKRQVIGA